LIALEAGDRRLVLKRYVNREWLAREPDLATREAATLELLSGSPVVAPGLVAVDPDGAATGVPSVLMTRLRGRHRWDPPSVERLADVSLAIREVIAPPGFRPYRRYVQPGVAPPAWTSRPAMWERAIAVADAATVPADQVGFIHRDHHAGNVLWWRGRVSGVVDWVEGCVGPPAVDTARVRINLVASAGFDAARRYARCPGIVINPVWDIVDAVDCLWGYGPDPLHESTEDFVADALAELG
jgi:aminoglycoside phosphotransferase (APT) family kinase protein